jgi:hypothetical protein
MKEDKGGPVRNYRRRDVGGRLTLTRPCDRFCPITIFDLVCPMKLRYANAVMGNFWNFY